MKRQIFYPYSKCPSTPKTDHDYLKLSTQKSTIKDVKGIKGPTSLTKILIFPYQIAKDYMHLVCSGHFKTLIRYWERTLLPAVVDQGSDYLMSIVLPHSFKYQFIPLLQYAQWKTRMFKLELLRSHEHDSLPSFESSSEHRHCEMKDKLTPFRN